MSVSHAMNLYTTTIRYVLMADPSDRSTWEDLYRLLPFLRQALGCCVCTKLLRCPMGPCHTVCPHHVCKECIGGIMRLKPSCSWCKDHSSFQENSHLSYVLNCFRSLCDYICGSQLGEVLQSYQPNGETNTLWLLIQEVIESGNDGDQTFSEHSQPQKSPLVSPVSPTKSDNIEVELDVGSPEMLQDSDQCEPSCSMTQKDVTPQKQTVLKRKLKGFKKKTKNNIPKLTINNVSESPASPPLSRGRVRKRTSSGIRVTRKSSENELLIDSPSIESPSVAKSATNKLLLDPRITPDSSFNIESATPDSVGPPTLDFIKSEIATKVKSKRYSADDDQLPPVLERESNDETTEPVAKRTRQEVVTDKKICKCGRASQPSRLTCLGQRCPCYSSHMACIGCKCRGCRNPRKGDKARPKVDTPAAVTCKNKRSMYLNDHIGMSLLEVN